MSPYVLSDALAGATHADLVDFIERNELVMDDPKHSGNLGAGINGPIRRAIVEDPVNPSRWLEVAVHRTDQGGAFNKLVHDVAVAANLEDSVIPVGRNAGMFVSARHSGRPLDMLDTTVGETKVTSVEGSKALQGVMQSNLVDGGRGAAEARLAATHAVQGAQLVNGIAASPDGHAGNHLLALDGSVDLRANDFGIMDEVDAKTGMPVLKPDYMHQVTSAPGMPPKPSNLPDGASFTSIEPELIERLRGTDRAAVAAAVERFNADIDGADGIGHRLELASVDQIPDGAKTVKLADKPGKVGIVADVARPARDLGKQMLGRIDDIVAHEGIRFMTRAAMLAR